MLRVMKRLWREEEGAALVEYGLLVGLIAVVCIAAVKGLGQEVSSMFSIVSTSL